MTDRELTDRELTDRERAEAVVLYQKGVRPCPHDTMSECDCDFNSNLIDAIATAIEQARHEAVEKFRCQFCKHEPGCSSSADGDGGMTESLPGILAALFRVRKRRKGKAS